MAEGPQRKIEHAIIESVGPVSAKQLIAMPETEWGLLRHAITDAWGGKPRRAIAECLMCGGGVFIRSKAFKGLRLPMFAHFKGADVCCPWFTGDTITPDAARADQYQGRQESVAHRLLCNQIAALAERDPTCTSVRIDRYLPPVENEHGRYPDVLATFGGRQVAFEVQLSNTFQTEISDRCRHYDREGIPLIWVLLGAEVGSRGLSQSFRDVILRHRGNAFVLDQAAVQASMANSRFQLTCYLRNASGAFDEARQIGIENLIFPEHGCPYVEDRVTPELLQPGKDCRAPWWSAMKAGGPDLSYKHLTGPSFLAANDDLCARVPTLRDWQRNWDQGRWMFVCFMTVVFSALSAAAGTFTNYASKQNNVQAMLNSKLSGNDMVPFVQIMHAILHRSALSHLLDGSVGVHLERALANGDGNFVLEADGVWPAVHLLLPELFNPMLRMQLETLGELPGWAMSDRAHLAFSFEDE